MFVTYTVNQFVHPYCPSICIKMVDGKLSGFGCNALLMANLMLNEMC